MELSLAVPIDSKPSLSVYGKLPLSKEFLRFRCNAGAAGHFYQWINAGYDHSIRTGRSAAGLVRHRWRVVFHADGMREIVVAVVRDSADNDELRRFPFACYSAVPRDALPEAPDQQLDALSPLFDELTAADAALSANIDLDGFKQTFAALTLKSLGSGPAVSRGLDTVPLVPIVEGLARRIAPGGDPRRVFTGMLFELASALRVLDSRRIPGERIPALRLPVFGGSDTLLQARAWLGCFAPCAFLAKRHSPVTLAVPSPTEAHADAWVLIRPPKPSDFTMFTAEPTGYFHPDPGGQVARVETEPHAAFSARVEGALLGADRTLADLARFRLV